VGIFRKGTSPVPLHTLGFFGNMSLGVSDL